MDRSGEWRVGATLGKYTLLRVIGSGGMATVYEARHKNGNRVALKLLKPAHSIAGDTRARFLREGYVANHVDHPGAVRVLDDDTTRDGLVFLVMELLDGFTLDALAKAGGGRLAPGVAFSAIKQVLAVLAAAHERGVVHRDIKPENVLVTRDGTAKVLDFGIARMREPDGSVATATGRLLGTPAFMAPEQAYGRRDEIDHRTDLWAVGATLFTLLSGRPVHVAQTAEETLVRAATEPPTALGVAWPDAPAAVASLVDRALSPSRDARFQTAGAMLEALEGAHRVAFGLPIDERVAFEEPPASATSPPPVAPRSGSRRLLGVLAATLVIASAAGLSRLHTPRPRQGVMPPVTTLEAPPSVDVPPVPATSALTSSPTVVRSAEPRSTLPLRAKASAPLAVGPATTSAALSPSAMVADPPPKQLCGVLIDEEGRKWPRRCP